MSSPPFRLASASVPLRVPPHVLRGPMCCEPHGQAMGQAESQGQTDASTQPDAASVPRTRLRLHELPAHCHCSVIGTCLTTAELRKLMTRHDTLDRKASDQDVHSAAVGMAAQSGDASKALHKALDRRHAATLAVFAGARDTEAVTQLWLQALERGEIPGAYWALLTHRETDDALRSRAFGDVHMLSHLVGASNRADIRRLVALERGNEALCERAERQQARLQAVSDERDALAEALRCERLVDRDAHGAEPGGDTVMSNDALLRQIALQTERREQAEQRSQLARTDTDRAAAALVESQLHADQLTRELTAAETTLRQLMSDDDPSTLHLNAHLRAQLHDRRIAYIGGRPSSTPTIRALVQRHGGRFMHHDGGLEDRKGLLTSTIVGADLVAFPMDCIDHDSVNMIKRLCARHGVAFLPLRTASATSLMSALAGARDGNGDGNGDGDPQRGPICLRHG